MNARGANATLAATADELERDRHAALAWRGSADESAAAVIDLARVAGELARRGLRATLTVEPVGDELLAAVRIT